MSKQKISSYRECVICGSKASGINFGAATCAPCRTFFRRNARRKQILEAPCQYNQTVHLTDSIDEKSLDSARCLQIRYCSSCRLRRCFDMGMKVELVRTEEENIRYKQLLNRNRQQRELLKQKQQEKTLSLFPILAKTTTFLREIDWCHLSHIVSAYETQCLKTYVQQRLNMYHTKLLSNQSTALMMNLTTSLLTFFRSLPAYHSLNPTNQSYLIKINLRPLLFVSMIELNQTCFSETWQILIDKSTWQFICGDDLYEQFVRIENLAERLYITDPITTRLWMVILFFSSSLFCLYEKYSLSTKYPKRKTSILNVQNIYITLLWNYLLHRYGYENCIQIYSNLINIYLKMQIVGSEICFRVRSRHELSITYQTVNQILTVENGK